MLHRCSTTCMWKLPVRCDVIRVRVGGRREACKHNTPKRAPEGFEKKNKVNDFFITVNHLQTLGKNTAMLAGVLPHGARVLILLSAHVVPTDTNISTHRTPSSVRIFIEKVIYIIFPCRFARLSPNPPCCQDGGWHSSVIAGSRCRVPRSSPIQCET